MKKPAATLPRLFSVTALGIVLSSCTVVTDPSSSSRSTGNDEKSSFTNDGVLKQDRKIQEFATVNFIKLKDDMALGQGEYLVSLATLLGINKSQQSEFFAFTKEKFPILFSSEQVTPTEMLASLNRELALDPRFSKRVAHN